MQAIRSPSWLAGIGSASNRRGIAIPRHASPYRFRKFVRRSTDTTPSTRPPPQPCRRNRLHRRTRSRHAPAFRRQQNPPSNPSPPCQRHVSSWPLPRHGMWPPQPRQIFSRPGHSRRHRRHLQPSPQPRWRGPLRTLLPGFPGSCARWTMQRRKRRSATGRPKAKDSFASSDAAARCAGMSSIHRQATMARWC